MTPTSIAALWNGRVRAFVLTFLAYMCIHIVRKPSSVLKSMLHPQDAFDFEFNPGWAPFNHDLNPHFVAKRGLQVSHALHSEENGLYTCTQFSSTDAQSCVTYTSSSLYQISHSATSPLCATAATTMTPENGAACWLLTKVSFPTARYVQLYNGPLPQALHGDDPHLKQKAWREVVVVDGGGGGQVLLRPYPALRVDPHAQDGKILLGLVDTVFLLAYTVGLFVSGHVADRVDIRYFLGLGMVFAGMSSCLLGLAHRFNIHSLAYFLLVSAGGGLAQSVGWPCVMAVMGRWFPKEMGNRGLIMGSWNANLCIGNILGSVITTAMAQRGDDMFGENWPMGYQVPGLIVSVMGLVVLMFLEERPPPPPSTAPVVNDDDGDAELEQQLLPPTRAITPNQASTPPPVDGDDDDQVEEEQQQQQSPPTLLRALLIPGIVPFSLALCFAKMAQYALLFWGPYYLQVVGFTSEEAGYLCSFFDVGGLCGGIAAGFLSDYWRGRRGTVASLFLTLSALCLLVYYHVTSRSGSDETVNILMMILVGFWVNGPVSLITTAVSADLASHPSLNGDERLIGSVAGIIDGSGSFGAALQGVVIGVISSQLSWDQVFQFLALCCLMASLLLSRVVWRELFSATTSSAAAGK